MGKLGVLSLRKKEEERRKKKKKEENFIRFARWMFACTASDRRGKQGTKLYS
ncbi:MAG: hypothetical protein ACRC62_24020 [Microcoleus sp.]